MINLGRIEVGEPDANAEYYIAKRSKNTPVFIRAHFDTHFHGSEEFHAGTKFILYGQKGTGKTAILRNMEAELSKEYVTQFIIFRKEILEEAELSQSVLNGGLSYVVDEQKMRETKFFYHAMKRLFLVLLVSQCDQLEPIPESDGFLSKLLSGIKGSPPGEVASIIFDSISSLLESINVNVSSVSHGNIHFDAAKAIKKSNDKLTKYCLSQIKEKKLKCKLFFDEMHFAYMDKSTLSADAALVRDTMLALRELNEKFIDHHIDCTIYMSIRSEFLQHPEIAAADVMQTIQSYGREISWEKYDYNKSHPIFDLMLSRLKISLGQDFDKSHMFQKFFCSLAPGRFLEYTWGKPRDIIRFFKCAKDSFPNKSTLNKNDLDSIIKSYTNLSWLEMKSALTAFMPKESIPILEKSLRSLATETLDGSAKRNTKENIINIMQLSYTDMVNRGVAYSIDEYFTLLYMVGVFYMEYIDAKEQKITHQFHRGNKQPADKGTVHLHYAIAKAFS